MTCTVIFTPISQKAMAEDALRNIGFARPLSPTSHTPKIKAERLRKKRKKLLDETEKAKQEIISFADSREEIKNTQDYFRIRADKYRVIGELDHSKHVFVIYGYIPEDDCEKLEKLCERAAVCDIQFGEAGDGGSRKA